MRSKDDASGVEGCRGLFGKLSQQGDELAYFDLAASAGEGASQVDLVAPQACTRFAFRGRLHNHRELAAELGLPADTAVEGLLLAAHARWPQDWPQRLDGEWVMAVVEPQQRCLTLYREATGVHGLYYCRSAEGALAYASHLDLLLAQTGLPPRLSRQGLHEYLHLLDIAAPNCIYQGVRAVPPGEAVLLRVGDESSDSVLPEPLAEPRSLSLQAAAKALEASLTQAIARRLDGVEHPAVFLSGGVDSALICALAARQRPDLTAITVGFEGADFDEASRARAIAQHLGIRHVVLRFGRDELTQALALAGQHAEQPMADPALPATLLAFAWARRHYDAVLDGSGADELMGAMPPRHLRVAVQWAARLPTALRRHVAHSLQHLPHLAGYRPIFDFEHPAETLRRWQGFLPAEIEALTGGAVHLAHTRFYQVCERFPPPAHYERYTALLNVMPGERLTQAMYITGLDVRFPYWNAAVAALLRALPLHLRWRQDSPKHLLRALLAHHLPRALWDVPKHGFNFPLHNFLTAEDFQLVRRYLLDADWERWQVVSPPTVADYARRFIAGEASLTFRVWALVVLAAWLEGHPGIARPAELRQVDAHEGFFDYARA